MCSVYLSAFCLIIMFFSHGLHHGWCWSTSGLHRKKTSGIAGEKIFTGWRSFLSLAQYYYCLITEVIQVAYVQFVPTLDYSGHLVIQPVYIRLWVKPDSQWPPRKVFGDCWQIFFTDWMLFLLSSWQCQSTEDYENDFDSVYEINFIWQI